MGEKKTPKEEAREIYSKLFDNDKDKAAAFDKIAEEYYYCNFGQMQKTDFETLLFSIYLERILDESEEEPKTYSDYTLSKYLGITQSKISNLKVRKQLKYPYENFDWKESFKRISKNARYEDGKIKINIPDRNLFLEIKNAVECAGGYIDVQLNQKLLQIRPEYFIDLLLEIPDDDDDRDKIKKELRKKLRKELKKGNEDTEYFDSKSVGDVIKDGGIEITESLIINLLSAFLTPSLGGKIVKEIATSISAIIKA